MTERASGAALAASKGGDRWVALDGLRAIAVLGVMILHYEARSWPYRTGLGAPIALLIGQGWLGVDIFFVLSGFLITGILFDSRRTAHYWRNYYARRTLRIFPLYYLALTLAFVVFPRVPQLASIAAIPPEASPAWFWGYASNVLLAVHGFGAMPRFLAHFWTLAIEEQFYLLWPLAVFLLDRRRLLGLSAALAVMSFVLRAYLFHATGGHLAGWALTPSRLDGLAIGAFCALLVRGERPAAELRALAWRLGGALLVAIVAVTVARRGANYIDPVVGSVGIALWSALFGCVVVLGVLSEPSAPIVRALGVRPLRTIGFYSYGMYVWHYVLLVALSAFGFTADRVADAVGSTALGHVAFLAANGVGTFVLAYASWHLYEKRFLRLKSRFAYDERGGRKGAVPPAVVPAGEAV